MGGGGFGDGNVRIFNNFYSNSNNSGVFDLFDPSAKYLNEFVINKPVPGNIMSVQPQFINSSLST